MATIAGGHFDAYLSYFEQSSGAARDWFVEVAHILTRFLTALGSRMSRPVPNTNDTERLGK
jgi:hypothetical protein